MWMAWLIRLRWLAVSAQALVISSTLSVLDRPAWTVPAMVAIIGALAAANLGAASRLEAGQEVDRATLFNHLWFDLAALTVMLLLTGGPANPFVMLYAVHVTLGAMVLGREGAAALFVAAVACFGLIHLGPLPLHLDHHPLLSARALGATGQAVAFVATLGSIGLFVVGMSESLQRREAQLREARARLGEAGTEEVPHPILESSHL
jgi:two-component system sensor histidine kinase RegB